MEKLFYSNERGEDLLKWCNSLDALGNVISFLAWANDGDSCFERSGVALGTIISDYANVIHKDVEEVHWLITKYFKNGDVSFVADLRETEADIEKGFMGPQGNLFLIREAVGKIDKYLNKDLKQILDIKKSLEKTGEEIKRALAEADTGAKAPEKEGQQPDSESTVTQQAMEVN